MPTDDSYSTINNQAWRKRRTMIATYRTNSRRARLLAVLPALGLALALGGYGQAQQPGPAAEKQLLQERMAALKQSIARNQEALKQYTWVERTEISLKCEVKSQKQSDCRYGPAGEIEKTPIGDHAPKKKRGIRGKIAKKKMGEMAEYMDRVQSLVSRYVPPSSQRLQASVQGGKASLQRSPQAHQATVWFRDYVKRGDQLALVFDTAARKIQSLDVSSYLDDAEGPVNLEVRFGSLADGTNFVEETVLDVPAKKIQVKNTAFGHRKIGP
jgi:hypothetical protein